MKGIVKALKLELNHIKENKIALLLVIILPFIIVSIFALAGGDYLDFAKTTYYNYFSPVIFSTIIIFISMQTVILRIAAERAPYGTLDRELIIISKSSMLMGKFLANILVAFILSIVVYVTGVFIFKVQVLGDHKLIFLMLLLLSFVGLGLGFLFSIIAKSKEQAVQLVPFTTLIFIVLSGMLVPLNSMPYTVNYIASLLPLTIATNALTDIMLRGKDLYDISFQLLKLLIWTAITLLISYGVFKIKK